MTETIIGALNWHMPRDLPAGNPTREHSRYGAVLWTLRVRCSAWLAGPDLLVTAWHCAPDATAIANVRAAFLFETGGAAQGAPSALEFNERWSCNQFVIGAPMWTSSPAM
ncbi:MAG TPA: hypothetical protein VKP02_13245, partial [Gemmatimonadaceae bacterium]|nr:hypothetical protein [Gemmatimonadaceae bacterium]